MEWENSVERCSVVILWWFHPIFPLSLALSEVRQPIFLQLLLPHICINCQRSKSSSRWFWVWWYVAWHFRVFACLSSVALGSNEWTHLYKHILYGACGNYVFVHTWETHMGNEHMITIWHNIILFVRYYY